jgi:hypothetical protein
MSHCSFSRNTPDVNNSGYYGKSLTIFILEVSGWNVFCGVEVRWRSFSVEGFGATLMPTLLYRAYFYTGCPGRNVPDFGRVFLMLKYADITQNTYVQSWAVTEIMAREQCGLLAGPRTVPVNWQGYQCPWVWLAHTSRKLHSLRPHCAELLKCILCFHTWNIVICILCMDFAMVMHVLLFKNTKGVFPIEGVRLEVYLHEFTRHCVILVLFQVFLCTLKGRMYYFYYY